MLCPVKGGITMQREQFDSVIIGGGVGGLTAGAYLSKAGMKTLLLEKNENIGGLAGTFFLDGYRFDVGGTPPYSLLSMLKDLGVHELVEFLPINNPAWSMYFPGFTIYGPKKKDEFLKQFQGLCTSREFQEFNDILSSVISIDMEKYSKLNQNLSESKIKFFMGLLKCNPFELMKVATLMMQDSTQWLRKNITNNDLFEVISFISGAHWMYPSARVPALLTVLILSWFTGKSSEMLHLIKGGNINYSLALEKAIERHNGVVKTNMNVKKILVKNGEARGVILENGEEIAGKSIVSNIGIRETVKYLVGIEHFEEGYVRKIESLKPSPSLFKVCLGIKKKPDLNSAINIKICDMKESAWWEAIEEGHLPEKPPLFIWNKSLIDSSMAPAGSYNVYIHTPAPYRHRDGDWDEVKKKERDKVMTVMEELIPGISGQIDFEWVLTPKDMEAYSGQEGGGILALEPSIEQFMKFPEMDLPIKNLYCVGATVKGGAGIYGAANTGKLCAQKIINQLRKGN